MRAFIAIEQSSKEQLHTVFLIVCRKSSTPEIVVQSLLVNDVCFLLLACPVEHFGQAYLRIFFLLIVLPISFAFGVVEGKLRMPRCIPLLCPV